MIDVDESGPLFRTLMANLPTSVTVIAAEVPDEGPGRQGRPGRRAGLVVGTFTSVSMEPRLVGFMPSSSSRSWAAVRGAGRFTASILASDQKDVCLRLAGGASTKFDEVATSDHDRPGVVAIRNSVAWFDCEIVDEFPAGDHTFVLAAPRDMQLERPHAHPLVFFRRAYHRTFQVEDLIAPGWG